MSGWLEGCLKNIPNTKFPKPCHQLGFCPYGPLVEEFPLHDRESEMALEIGYVQDNGEPDLNRYISEFGYDIVSCKAFGHACPVFYCGEDVTEHKKEEILNKLNNKDVNVE